MVSAKTAKSSLQWAAHEAAEATRRLNRLKELFDEMYEESWNALCVVGAKMHFAAKRGRLPTGKEAAEDDFHLEFQEYVNRLDECTDPDDPDGDGRDGGEAISRAA